MVLRISHPNQPTRRIDLGPGAGRHHNWDLMRRTVDDLPRPPKPKRTS